MAPEALLGEYRQHVAFQKRFVRTNGGRRQKGKREDEDDTRAWEHGATRLCGDGGVRWIGGWVLCGVPVRTPPATELDNKTAGGIGQRNSDHVFGFGRGCEGSRASDSVGDSGSTHGFSMRIVCSTGVAVFTRGSTPRPNWYATTFTSTGNTARVGSSAIRNVPPSMTAGPTAT